LLGVQENFCNPKSSDIYSEEFKKGFEEEIESIEVSDKILSR
jgi:hypothetical protein